MTTQWKRTERRVAGILGGKRVPVTGRGRGDAPDIQHPWLCPEVKHRRKLPAWLHEAMAQARAAATSEQLPIVVLHESGQRHTNDMVLVRLSDFQGYFGADLGSVEQPTITEA